MPKRFCATERWDKEWYRRLSCRHKCLWEYIVSRCDAAGVWEPDYGLASFQIGEQVSERDLAAFAGRVEKLPSGKLFVPGFIPFQYGQLHHECKPHASILVLIDKHQIGARVQQAYANPSDTLAKGLANPSLTLQEKEKEKEKDKEPEKETETEKDRKRVTLTERSKGVHRSRRQGAK